MSHTTDKLQPTQQQLDTATDNARTYWHTLAEQALAHHNHGTIPQHTFPRHMLHRTPAIPTTPLNLEEQSFRSSKFLSIDGSSTMRANEGWACGVDEVVKTVRGNLLIGIQTPVSCTWTGTSFRQWIENENGNGNGKASSYPGILSLAWSYILSSRLTEIQRHEGTRVEYTDATAAGYLPDSVDESDTAIGIDIGSVDRHTARWWAAILAPGLGWKAIVTQRENNIYLTPWTVSLEINQRVEIIWRDNGRLAQDADINTPPSSQAALEILAEFCQLHGIDNQFFAALGTALIFPTHHHFKREVELPLPTETRDQQHASRNELDSTKWLAISDELPYYMALSCNYNVVISSLCAMFWEPDVECNLVSPWLHPILTEVSERHGIMDIPGRYAEILALICGIRRPRLFVLWIGAAISGLVPRILRFVKTGTPPSDALGFSWTGCPRSFMDTAGSGPYFHGDSSEDSWIDRADVWRLLYLPVKEDDGLHYEGLPFSPWPPVGRAGGKNCVLRVKAHRSCPRHYLAYEHWTWKLRNGSEVHDRGFNSDKSQRYLENYRGSPVPLPSTVRPIIPLSPEQEASHEASTTIFYWVLANHEGKPPEPIYDDEWITECFYPTDESDQAVEDDVSSDNDFETNTTENKPSTESGSWIYNWINDIS